MNDALAADVWARLLEGRPLDGLPVGTHGGRVDLRGLRAADPGVLRTYEIEHAAVSVLDLKSVASNASWRRLDFTGSRLNGLRLFHVDVEDCIFDDCEMQDMRLWASSIRRTSVRRADLRKAALGGVFHDRLNAFNDVDFGEADLRQSVYKAASFTDCDFSGARLEKLDFQTSAFVRCRFAGELSHVLFYRRGFKGEAFPPNDMEEVDFGAATLHCVEFRGLDLKRVKLPADEQHLIVPDYAATLDDLIRLMKERGDVGSARIAAALGVRRKWAGPAQERGVLNIRDLTELGGPEAADALRRALARLLGARARLIRAPAPAPGARTPSPPASGGANPGA